MLSNPRQHSLTYLLHSNVHITCRQMCFVFDQRSLLCSVWRNKRDWWSVQRAGSSVLQPRVSSLIPEWTVKSQRARTWSIDPFVRLQRDWVVRAGSPYLTPIITPSLSPLLKNHRPCDSTALRSFRWCQVLWGEERSLAAWMSEATVLTAAVRGIIYVLAEVCLMGRGVSLVSNWSTDDQLDGQLVGQRSTGLVMTWCRTTLKIHTVQLFYLFTINTGSRTIFLLFIPA